MLNRSLVICLFGAFCIPIAAWALYKPTRVLAPELNGVSCVSNVICMDDVSRYEEAAGLYDEAYEFVTASVGAIETKPRVIFCASKACFQSFGYDKAAAHTVGVLGIALAPRGWKNYYLRHEMIHHMQAERMGVLDQWLSPEWFKEGMAYSLGQDPRPNLSEPWQQYRSDFETWYQTVGKERLWEEACKH